MRYSHDNRSHKKAILSLYQVGVPSKHAQNEDEIHLNSNNITKRNINGPIRDVCMQDSGPPVISTISFTQKWGAQRKTTK